MPRRFLVLLLAVVVVLATACEVNTTVDLTVNEDGSGEVTVSVGLDAEALQRLSRVAANGESGSDSLAAIVRTDDLVAAGWDVRGPFQDGAEVTWLQATKPFGTPAEAGTILAEIAGEDGPLGDLRLERSSGYASTSFELTGTIDLSGGLAIFSDAELRELLGGRPFGESIADIEERLGQPLSESFHLDVLAELPGNLETNADDTSGNTARWSPQLGDDPVAVEATSSIRHWSVVALTAVAVVAGLALAAVLAWLTLRRVSRGSASSRLPRGAGESEELHESEPAGAATLAAERQVVGAASGPGAPQPERSAGDQARQGEIRPDGDAPEAGDRAGGATRRDEGPPGEDGSAVKPPADDDTAAGDGKQATEGGSDARTDSGDAPVGERRDQPPT